MSLSQDLAPHTIPPMEITDDVLVCADPPTPFKQSCEFEVGDNLETPHELDLSITTYNEHHEMDE